MYKIMGKYRGSTEQIDETDKEATADFLVSEYRLAFGNGWTIWKEKTS